MSLQEAESILQMLADSTEAVADAEAFTTLESNSDSEESVQLNYKSSHDALDDPEEEESDRTSTPEPTKELSLVPGDRQSPIKTECAITPPADEAEDHTPTPPV